MSETEIAHYREHGWAKLDGFVSTEVVAALIDMARRKLGQDGDDNAVNPESRVQFLNNAWVMGIHEPGFDEFIASIGDNARRLMGRNVGTRYLMDSFVTKLPAHRPSKHNARAKTDVHQDYPTWSLDRTGGMSFWVALADATPKSGTMEFFSGSHRMGPLGGFITHTGRDLTDVYPELREKCPSSGHLNYKAGDATVHSDLCAHGTGQNLSNDPRWAYIIGCIAQDASWNGGPNGLFDTEGMTPFAPLDDGRFPVIGEPA